MNNKHDNIVYEALGKFQELTGIKAIWNPIEQPENLQDGIVTFHDKRINEVFITEIKNEVRNHHLELILENAQKAKKPFILIGGNIYPSVKEYLKKNKINYLDVAGNAFINYKDLLIYIDGQKRKNEDHQVMLSRSFTKAGLKTTFVLLTNDHAINYPIRTLAKIARVSVGAVTGAIAGLKAMGFIVRLSKDKYKLDLHRILTERWISGYQERLKPDLYLGNFKLSGDRDWEHIQLDHHSLWGSETAAYKLRKHLVPAIVTIYTEDTKLDFMKKYQLIPDAEGRIILYKKFWENDVNTKNTGIVPRLLIYTDLMDTTDVRCIEEAQEIFKSI